MKCFQAIDCRWVLVGYIRLIVYLEEGRPRPTAASQSGSLFGTRFVRKQANLESPAFLLKQFVCLGT